MKLFDLRTRLWENPKVPQVNLLRSRSPLFSWGSEEEARKGSYEPFECPAIESLNGQWRFWFYERPEDVPPALLAGEEVAGETSIQVPGNWMRQGFDHPQYINVCMPFPDAPPMVPQDRNPCGVYRRNFLARKEMERLVLHFGGIESCGFIYVNGREVGMVKDSRTSSEFDVTEFVKPGEENQLTVLVLRWSDGSFLEDQDHWRMGGIFRDVYLHYTPDAHIADVFAQATLDEETESEGILNLRLDAAFRCAHQVPAGWRFRVRLFDPSGKAVWPEPKELGFFLNGMMYQYPEERRWQPLALETFHFPGVQTWSAETPVLYRLTVALLNPRGECVEATGVDVGFRSVRRKDGCLMINGRPVRFFGVNRHDFDPVRGKAVTPEGILQDLLLMKSMNINAIRTSHYPNDERLAALASRLGFYVISEANIEVHAYYDHLTDDPLWMAGMMDRFQRMVLIYKNNPCIHLWSMGNEAGQGANFYALAAWAHAFDSSRGVHYSEFTRPIVDGYPYPPPYGGKPPRGSEFLIDTISPMYTPFFEIERWIQEKMPTEDRPLIFCEYSHAMGNSNGSLDRYFHYFRNYRRIQGGFVWDWKDQGLLEHDARGRKYFAYGGDYGEKNHDTNFCGNGLVSADLTRHPASWEFQFLARPFDFQPADEKKQVYALRNWRYFTTLDDLEFSWVLQRDGKVLAKGILPRESTDGVAPQESRAIDLDALLEFCIVSPGQELFLTITGAQRSDTPWQKAGYVVAEQQFDLTKIARVVTQENPLRLEPARLAFSQNTISDGESVVHFTDGAMPDQWIFRGQKLLLGKANEQFVRGLVDNDVIKAWIATEEHRQGGRWIKEWDVFHLKESEKLASSTLQKDGSLVMESTATYTARNGAAFTVARRLHFRLDGILEVELTYEVPEKLYDPPRLGVTLPMPKSFETLRFFGEGPRECYWDRHAGSQVGLYEQKVSEQLFPYLRPQESGNHVNVRAIALENGAVGLLAVGAGMFLEASALHATPASLFAADHINEMPDEDATYLNLDLHQRGLGTASCGENPQPEYEFKPGSYRLAFRLLPYVPGENDLMELVRCVQKA